MNETYYTPQQVAELFGVKVETVWKWLRTGQLHSLNLNRKTYRITQQDINSFIKKQQKNK